MSFSRGDTIALWTGLLLMAGFLSAVFYRLCSVTVRTMLSRIKPVGKKKKMNAQEKKVNKILSNESAREILKSRAITAINSQANKSRRGRSSQFSLDSIGTIPDLTDRVVRVSFAPTGNSGDEQTQPNSIVNQVPEIVVTEDVNVSNDSIDLESVSGVSEGGMSGPPPYDTLSTHSRVSASDPPPEYSAINSPV